MSSGKFDALAAKVGSPELAGWITNHNPKVHARAEATRAAHKAEHKAKIASRIFSNDNAKKPVVGHDMAGEQLHAGDKVQLESGDHAHVQSAFGAGRVMVHHPSKGASVHDSKSVRKVK